MSKEAQKVQLLQQKVHLLEQMEANWTRIHKSQQAELADLKVASPGLCMG